MNTIGGVAQAILEAASAALGDGAKVVEARARNLAPIRHIFAEDRYTIRFKKVSEIERDRSIRATLGLSFEGSPENPRPRTIRARPADAYGRRPTPKWRERRMGVAQQHAADYAHEQTARKLGLGAQPTALDRRGAYEVRSRRAAFLRWGHSYVGGRLRGEIFSTGAVIRGRRAEAWVISPTPYARYMEFGTRHNAAHPFLRPAAEESRGEVVALIADAVRGALPHGGANVEIEVVVRL